MLVAEDGVPHQELIPWIVETEHEAMAAFEEQRAVTTVDVEGEAAWRDAIGGLKGGLEVDFAIIFNKAANEGRVAAVVCEEAAGEAAGRW